MQKVILNNDLNASRYLIAAESKSFCFVEKVVNFLTEIFCLKSTLKTN